MKPVQQPSDFLHDPKKLSTTITKKSMKMPN